MTRFAAIVTVLALSIGSAQAGKFNKVLNPGDKAPTFQKLQGTDEKEYSSSDFSKDVVVVVVTCNKCPAAIAYEDRLIEFTKKYSGKVDVVAINVNNSDADKMDKMIERSKEKGFNFPYLYDPTQKIAMALGAARTPEFFVINKAREVVYMGAFDDDMRAENVKKQYVVDAVEAALAGKMPTVKETAARGCGIQFEKSSK
ncbi:thioredoxin family protein [Tuwongella immobilis]|uniref:Thioredoxin domain-containing protein n=1 Tax=Tuwongella immobilis TaxID=692036 RepID=A0A6C2YMF3_9BACT|nr:thioredoxin family protein [Tuwongella immobilis]VIP02399.1 alkyl hydroperoxide reductase : Uncharacterized protein OS=Planctomyces maris DSM 8797 GN=PM8797T_11409 PE=4 SV=1: Redoxin [Tuwongella immobilis]VTS01283.1 alkyl hydroperoxide reductase : Uncharacterized protein OS=Planctomyces maris DSM 8797 GN=PM8797T_11409 PE=4 SV=1: Redoxin [Tuwongella immobilis]